MVLLRGESEYGTRRPLNRSRILRHSTSRKLNRQPDVEHMVGALPLHGNNRQSKTFGVRDAIDQLRVGVGESPRLTVPLVLAIASSDSAIRRSDHRILPSCIHTKCRGSYITDRTLSLPRKHARASQCVQRVNISQNMQQRASPLQSQGQPEGSPAYVPGRQAQSYASIHS